MRKTVIAAAIALATAGTAALRQARAGEGSTGSAGSTAAAPTPGTAQPPPAPPAWGISVKEHVMIAPQQLDWKEGPASLPPGAKVAVIEGDPKVRDALFTIRLKLPANYRIAPHHHLADEHVTVLSGRFDMGTGDRYDPSKLHALPAGSFMVMPAGSRHFALTRAETEIQVHAVGPWALIYANPADDPRNQAKR